MEKAPEGSMLFSQAISKLGVYWLIGKKPGPNILIKIEVVEVVNDKLSSVKVFWDGGHSVQLVNLSDSNWDSVYIAFDNYWFAYAAQKQMEKNHGHPVHP